MDTTLTPPPIPPVDGSVIPPVPPTIPDRKFPVKLLPILPIVALLAALPFLAKSVRERQLAGSQAKTPPNTYCVATFGCPTPSPTRGPKR